MSVALGGLNGCGRMGVRVAAVARAEAEPNRGGGGQGKAAAGAGLSGRGRRGRRPATAYDSGEGRDWSGGQRVGGGCRWSRWPTGWPRA